MRGINLRKSFLKTDILLRVSTCIFSSQVETRRPGYVLLVMYTEAEHTLAAREKLLAYNGYPDDDDAESLLLQENQPYISSICLKRFHPRLCFSQRYLPWILHTVGILICSALVLHANNILKKSHRGCIEKFNAWCE